MCIKVPFLSNSVHPLMHDDNLTAVEIGLLFTDGVGSKFPKISVKSVGVSRRLKAFSESVQLLLITYILKYWILF